MNPFENTEKKNSQPSAAKFPDYKQYENNGQHSQGPNTGYDEEYGPQAGYQQHGYSGPGQTGPPINFSSKPTGSGPTFEDKFEVSKPKWNDVWFIPIFLAVVGGFIAIAVITLKEYVHYRGFEGGSIYSTQNTFTLNTNTIILFGFVTVTAVVLAILYYTMARMFTKQFIIGTIIMNLTLSIGTAIYYLVEGYWSAGIVFLVWGVFSAFCYWTMRKRIPFATIVLQTVIDVTRLFPSTLLISALGAIVSGSFAVLFSVVMVSTYVKYNTDENNPSCTNGDCSNGKLIGLLIYVTFAAYYISEVIKNVIHTSICGVYGSWYYCYKSNEGMPKWPAFGAFKRAMTYSFGSITFGSLIVAFINLLKELVQLAAQLNADNGGNIFIGFIICIAQCFIGIIDWAIQYFNHYAYTYIALYGKAYIPAAKDTWTIIKSRGIDALINDSLINNVLIFGSTFIGFVTALLGYFYLRFTHPAYNSGGGYYPIIVAYSLLIGIQIANITTVSITSGVATFFVALAKDPEVFQMSYPGIYENLLQAYPAVRDKLNLH